MFRQRLMLCAAAGAATLGITSLVVHADAQQASGQVATVSAPAVRTGTTSAQTAASAVQQPAVHTSQAAQAAGSAAASSSVSRTAAAPTVPTAPQDIRVKDPLGIACIDVGAAGCEANNVAVSTGGPAKACGNPHIALSPFTGEVQPCP
jgi:hypothetical protein